MIEPLHTVKPKEPGGVLGLENAAKHFNLLIDKINEIITELNIILQEREHYCKVYEEVVKPAMLPEKKKKEETRPIPAYINGIGECIVYTTCDKCVDKFQIFKTSSGKIAIYCPCCGKVLKYEKRK